jgi:hypothetical protein
MYYIAKVKFETINDQNGKPKTVKEEYLVAAESVSKVEEKLNDKFGEGMSEFSVAFVNESKILGVLD